MTKNSAGRYFWYMSETEVIFLARKITESGSQNFLSGDEENICDDPFERSMAALPPPHPSLAFHRGYGILLVGGVLCEVYHEFEANPGPAKDVR